MVSEDYTVVLLFDPSDTSAELIKRSFSAIDVAHQMHRVADADALKNYLKVSIEKENSDKYIRPGLIVLHTRSLNSQVESMIEYVKNDVDLKRIPVLVLSASSNSQDIETAYRLKANSFIVCPDAQDEIDKVITEVASYWLKWNQLPT